MGPIFLEIDEILEIHRDQLERYGGQAGIRDFGLLSSALAQPSATFDGKFLHEDLPAMAAAYLFHLVQNHPIIDGNKRVGALSAYVFLQLNGFDLNASEEEYEALVLAVARGETDKQQVTGFFRLHASRSARGLE